MWNFISRQYNLKHYKGQSQLKDSQWYKRNGFHSLTPAMRNGARPGAGQLLAAKKGMEGFLQEAVVLDVFIEIAKNQSQTLNISAL